MGLTDVLRIENLVVEYATRRGTARALDKAYITLEENKTLGLAGESGCGKSTLGRAIMRLVPYPGKIIEGDIYLNLDEIIPAKTEDIPKGEVNLMSLDEEQMRALRGRMIAYIFQDPMTSLNPMLTVGEHFIQIMKAHDEEIEDEDALDRADTTLQFANNLYTNAIGATASLGGESGLGVINDIMESRDRAEDLYNKTEKLLKKMRGE